MEKQTHIQIFTEEDQQKTIKVGAEKLANDSSREDLIQEKSAIFNKYQEYLRDHPNDTVMDSKRTDFQIQLQKYAMAIQMKTPKKAN